MFEGFYAQLVKTTEIDEMKSRLRSILANNNADKALLRKQKADLRQLVWRLVRESERVIQARAKSERDVRGFLKSGLADEHMRVGAILQDIFQAALEVDWQSHVVRRRPGPLPPLSMSLANLPVIERLLVKQFDQFGDGELDLTVSEADPAAMDQELRQALQALNQARLFEATVAQLHASGKPLTLGELAKALPPTHDLETLAYWLAMARQAGIAVDEQTESIDLRDETDAWTRFHVPALELDYESVRELQPGDLE